MANTIFDDLAVAYMRKLVRDFDLEDFQAAGIVGNGGTESGGFTQIQEISPTAGRGGLGHFQWTGPRRRDFEAWLARNADKGWAADTFDANYSMLFRELVEGGPEHASIVALKQTRTLDDATETFCEKFERPGVINMTDRRKWATRAMAAWKASGLDAVAIRAQGRPGEVIKLPDTGGGPRPAENPIAGVSVFLQENKAKAKSMVMGIIGAHNMIYPDDLIVVQPPTPPVTPAKTDRPSVQLGFAGVIGSLIAMATGHLGTPLGMGEAPTVAGNVVPLVSALVSGVGLLGGGWTGLIGPALKIVGGLASKAGKP